jgi:putative aldouronate transport system permease protein
MLIHAFFVVLVFIFTAPLLVVLSTSLTSERQLGTHGYSLIPHDITLSAYRFLFTHPEVLLRAYGVSIFVTIVGSMLSLTLMSLLAYPLSRRDFKFGRALSFIVFFTLLFNGGIVPFYILMTRYLDLSNSLVSLFPAYLVLPFYVLILRTYFASVPRELIESAKIDGAGEWRIFLQIVVPLSKPALATIGLFSALVYWNDFFQSLLFISDSDKFPVQYLLYSFLTTGQIGGGEFSGARIPTQPVQMALGVLAILPILLAFIPIRKFFVRGITVGAIKT